MPDGSSIEIRVTRAEGGMRLDRLLRAHVPWRSRPNLKALIETGGVKVNGSAAKPATRVSFGDHVQTPICDPRGLSRQSLERFLDVLIEDPDFLVINKPAGLSTHATGRHLKENVVGALRWRYGEPCPMPVHRLDLETSGALLCARNREAHRALALQFERREVKKRYLAIVSGSPRKETGVLQGRIGRGGGSRVRIRVSALGSEGAPARTDYRVVGRWEMFSLLELWPRTGRQHQIRAQLEAAGHPVLGDKIYGPDEEHFLAHLEGRLSAEAKDALQLERHALHAATLVFRHPRTRRILRAEAPLPRDMQRFIERPGKIVAEEGRPKTSGVLQSKGEDGISPRL